MNKELLRKENFPVFGVYPDLVYLDSSATQQKPARVMQAVERYYREENANPLRGLYDLSVKATDVYEGAREAVRRFINAKDSAEIVFTRNATESLNLVAQSWGRAFLHEGDEILVSIAEHHSNLLPWQLIAKEKGASLRFLECDRRGRFSEDDLKAALTPKTKLFAITQISNIFGRVNRADGHRRAVRQAGTARSHAPLSIGRRDDRICHPRERDLCPSPPQV